MHNQVLQISARIIKPIPCRIILYCFRYSRSAQLQTQFARVHNLYFTFIYMYVKYESIQISNILYEYIFYTVKENISQYNGTL